MLATVSKKLNDRDVPANGASQQVLDSIILKILVIGDPCVGKTSYVQRYVNGTFQRNYKGTIGDFALKVIPWGQGDVKVQLWDIAGQERYSSMTRVYYRDSHGCLVMFDLTSRNSFINVVKWKRDFDAKCVPADGGPNIPCALLANKVSEDEIEQLCNDLRFTCWAYVSVKDNTMVTESLRYVIGAVIDQNQPMNHVDVDRLGAIRLNDALPWPQYDPCAPTKKRFCSSCK